MAGAVSPASAVVVDTGRSQFARLRPVPVSAVRLSDQFWAPRLRLNREVTLPTQYRLLEETGRLENFRRVAGKSQAPFQGFFFNDSDVYKWLEAVAWALAAAPEAALSRMTEAVIDEIAAAQSPDGYLNTYHALERADERWTNLRDRHELYCAGHLFQAAVAHARATGSERLLTVARRFADHICATFGPKTEGKRPGVCGHPEVEMALVELARATGEAKYLRQAQYFLDARGHGLIGGRDYHQDHRPLREMDRLAGHAVRAAYLNAGAADLVAETGDAALRAALERMWDHLVGRQMYLTGGIGSRHEGEAFGDDYELPNARAYAETCAAIALVMWAWRLLALDGAARYADVMETALYNGVLAGLSLDGAAYFYVNPLADDGRHRRQPWYDCACCPPNIARTLAALPGYFYSTSAEGVYVHLYAASRARLSLADGRLIGLTQRTRYPWDGGVEVEVDAEGEFGLFLRVPAWCEAGATLAVNGQAHAGQAIPGSYAAIRRHWRRGDVVTLDLPMPVRQVEAHPYALENTGRAALLRGPLVYCLEGADHPGVDLRDVVLSACSEYVTLSAAKGLCISTAGDSSLPSVAQNDRSLYHEVLALQFAAHRVPPDTAWAGRLYRTRRANRPADAGQTITCTAIPYYAWANREPGPLQVWLR